RPPGRLFPRSRRRSDPHDRLPLGRGCASHHGEARGRGAARVPQSRRRRELLGLAAERAPSARRVGRGHLGPAAALEARPADLCDRQRPERRVSQRRQCRARTRLGLTMTTGIGSALAAVYYTLSGLAAVVVGGVSLAGGRGGVVGPVLAAFVLTLIPADLIFLNIDPNFGQVIQGTLIVAIVMIGGFLAMARSRR